MFHKSRAVLFFFPLIFFLLIPLHLALENLQDIPGNEIIIVTVLVVITFVACILTISSDYFLRKVNLDHYFLKAIEYLFFFVLITGFVLPASESSGMVDAELSKVSSSNLVISIFLAALLFYVARSRFRTTLYQFISIYILLNFALSLQPFISGRMVFNPEINFARLSQERNILVISLDGISNSKMKMVLDNSPELREEFAGFTFFDQVASSSPSTSASIATSLYGNRNYKPDYKTHDELWAYNSADLLTNALDAQGYDVRTFGIYNKNLFNAGGKILPFSSGLEGHSTVNLLNYSIARTVTHAFVIRGNLRTRLLDLLQDLLGRFDGAVPKLLVKINKSTHHYWKRHLAATLLDYRRYIDHLKVTNGPPSAHFLHFTFTHFPVEFDRDCVYHGDDLQWFNSRQNNKGAEEEVHCAALEFIRFLKKIRGLKVYDKSLIVLKSDHGKPVHYYPKSSINSFRINNHKLWGIGRYEPFLAIKGFDETGTGQIKISGESVLLDDLAKSLCLKSASDLKCDKYPGLDIFEEPLKIPAESEVTLFIPESADSSFRYGTHIPITVNREPSIITNLHAELSKKLLTDFVSCNVLVDVGQFETLDNGFSDLKSWLTWTVGSTAFFRFRSNSSCLQNKTLMRLRLADTVSELPIVKINGVVAKVEWTHIKDYSQAVIQASQSQASQSVKHEFLIEVSKVNFSAKPVEIHSFGLGMPLGR